jgi:Calcineurin-like phosphoesterase
MNINNNIKYIFISLTGLTITIVFSLLLNFQIHTFGLEYKQQQNATLIRTDHSIIPVGDWTAMKKQKKTIDNILTKNPNLVITTGDHVKKSPSAACWMNMSKPIHDKMKIAIGNHDAEFANIYKQIVNYHNLKYPYYSHDFENIHFISMSTEHPLLKGANNINLLKVIYKMYPIYLDDFKKMLNSL